MVSQSKIATLDLVRPLFRVTALSQLTRVRNSRASWTKSPYTSVRYRRWKSGGILPGVIGGVQDCHRVFYKKVIPGLVRSHPKSARETGLRKPQFRFWWRV